MSPEELWDMHFAGAQSALERIENQARIGTEQLEAGELPGASLTELVIEYDRHITALNTMRMWKMDNRE